MCNTFLHEIQVILPANEFQPVCYTLGYTATLFTIEAVDYKVDPALRPAHLSSRRWAGDHVLFSDGSFQE